MLSYWKKGRDTPPPPVAAAALGVPDAPTPAQALLAAIRENRQRPHLRTVYPRGAAEALVVWIQEEGLDGWLTVAEFDACWEECRKANGWHPIPVELVREAVRAVGGVIHKRTRLNGPEFAEVKARLKRLKLGCDRATLFCIPAQSPACAGQNPSTPSPAPAGHRAGRVTAGQPQAAPEGTAGSAAGQVAAVPGQRVYRALGDVRRAA